MHSLFDPWHVSITQLTTSDLDIYFLRKQTYISNSLFSSLYCECHIWLHFDTRKFIWILRNLHENGSHGIWTQVEFCTKYSENLLHHYYFLHNVSSFIYFHSNCICKTAMIRSKDTIASFCSKTLILDEQVNHTSITMILI